MVDAIRRESVTITPVPEDFGELWYCLHSSDFTVMPVRGKEAFLPAGPLSGKRDGLRPL